MIIALSGPAGSGKDTIADIFVCEYGFVKVSLAAPIKRICQNVFGFTNKQMWGPSYNRNIPDKRYPRTTPSNSIEYLTPRYAIQRLGTNWGRDCYPDIWTNYALRVASLLEKNDPSIFYSEELGLIQSDPNSENYYGCTKCNGVIISDCRFRNEMSAIKKAGGKIIRVKRDDAGLKGEAGRHISEQEQKLIPDSEFDYILDNNCEIEELNNRVNTILTLLH